MKMFLVLIQWIATPYAHWGSAVHENVNNRSINSTESTSYHTLWFFMNCLMYFLIEDCKLPVDSLLGYFAFMCDK